MQIHNLSEEDKTHLRTIRKPLTARVRTWEAEIEKRHRFKVVVEVAERELAETTAALEWVRGFNHN